MNCSFNYFKKIKKYVIILFMSFLIFQNAFVSFAGGKSTHVNGYYKANGTYVQPHYRSAPDNSVNNNWSTKGNVNPYTGKEGTKIVPSYSVPSSGNSNSLFPSKSKKK